MPTGHLSGGNRRRWYGDTAQRSQRKRSRELVELRARRKSGPSWAQSSYRSIRRVIEQLSYDWYWGSAARQNNGDTWVAGGVS